MSSIPITFLQMSKGDIKIATEDGQTISTA